MRGTFSADDEAPRSVPPEAWEPMLRLARLASRPLDRFLRIQAASGILLALAAGAALVWANSPWGESYGRFWGTPVAVRVGRFAFERSLEWVVNDVLMAVFFFVVGMEIRRELHHGELSDWRRAALPAVAALGGMIAPALLYLATVGGGAGRAGWGIPMATDIAFAVGVLVLLGDRVPAALRVLLLALAVIDDLGAILIIAIFYSPSVALPGLAVAALGVAAVFAQRAMGFRRPVAYFPAAFTIWAGIYVAGVHPTIAGVVVGLLTPVRAWLGPEGFVAEVSEQLHRVAQQLDGHEPAPALMSAPLRRVDAARREAISPAELLIGSLHPWVAYAIMPLFALANAGVPLRGLVLDAPALRVAGATAIGLVLGKPIGVVVASLLAVRLRVAALPAGLLPRHLVVLGLVAGIGFTMSLFIDQLAFDAPPLRAAAKLAVLLASATAAVAGLLVGRLALPAVRAAGVAETADEAESSAEERRGD